MLNARRAREVLEYSAESGKLFWRVARGRMPAGAVAGVKVQAGYVGVRVDGARYLAHRLAWLISFNEWPKGEIDHVNGIRDDNRLDNLRDVGRPFNQQNQRRAQSSNSTGFLGVSPSDAKGRYRARIFHAGKEVHLGSFSTPEEAHAVYLKAKRELHPGGTI